MHQTKEAQKLPSEEPTAGTTGTTDQKRHAKRKKESKDAVCEQDSFCAKRFASQRKGTLGSEFPDS